MQIYVKEGESLQNVLSDGITKEAAGLGSEYILMNDKRPTSEHVAAVGGVWVIPESTQEETGS